MLLLFFFCLFFLKDLWAYLKISNIFLSVFLFNQAKKLVESLPQEIRANVSKEEAEKLKASLEAAGGTVVLE